MRKYRKFTEEEKLFLGEAIKERRLSEVTEIFNERFNPPATKGMLQDLCERLGLRCNYPNRTLPVGSERMKAGCVYIKAAGGSWRNRLAVLWEKANGEVPKGHVVIPADRDMCNTSPDNLLLVSLAELAVMNNNGLYSTDPDITRLGHVTAKMRIAASRAVREKMEKRNLRHYFTRKTIKGGK